MPNVTPESGPGCWCCDGRRSGRESNRCLPCFDRLCGHRDYPLAGKTTLHKGISLDYDNITEYRVATTELSQAEVVSSIVSIEGFDVDRNFHYPIFDVDFPIYDLGDGKFQIDKQISIDEHARILWRLHYAGIVTVAQIHDALAERCLPTFYFDVPVDVVPSTTPGHFHVYIDRKIAWEGYLAILDAFAEAGIVQENYVAASKARGYTSVRLPWVKKPNGTQDPF